MTSFIQIDQLILNTDQVRSIVKSNLCITVYYLDGSETRMNFPTEENTQSSFDWMADVLTATSENQEEEIK